MYSDTCLVRTAPVHLSLRATSPAKAPTGQPVSERRRDTTGADAFLPPVDEEGL
jgi:hypothetical protein